MGKGFCLLLFYRKLTGIFSSVIFGDFRFVRIRDDFYGQIARVIDHKAWHTDNFDSASGLRSERRESLD